MTELDTIMALSATGTGWTPPTISLEELKAFGPCKERLEALAAVLTLKGPMNAQQAVNEGATFSDLLWIVSKVSKEGGDSRIEKRLRLFACDCAARVLHIYEQGQQGEPSDAPRNAIIVGRRYALGKASKEELNAAAYAANAAAYAAAYAANAAAAAAANAAAYADADAAAAADATAYTARAAEREWQLERLVYWLMEENPVDFPIDLTEGE